MFVVKFIKDVLVIVVPFSGSSGNFMIIFWVNEAKN